MFDHKPLDAIAAAVVFSQHQVIYLPLARAFGAKRWPTQACTCLANEEGVHAMRSSSYDPRDTIADGLDVYAAATNDGSAVSECVMLYRLLGRKIVEVMRPGDTCQIALPSMIVGPGLRTMCLVIVLQDRVIVVYERGRFRKTPEALIIPKSTITEVHRHSGSTASTRQASLLTITGSPSATIALPVDSAAAVAALVHQAIAPTGS